MGLLGVLEMEDAEEQRIFGGVQQHEGGALQTQLTPLSSCSLGGHQVYNWYSFIAYLFAIFVT